MFYDLMIYLNNNLQKNYIIICLHELKVQIKPALKQKLTAGSLR